MATEIISNMSVPGFEIESWLMKGEVLHRVTVVGPVGLTERVLMYQSTLEVNKSRGNAIYFCVFDNSAKHENVLTYDDLKRIDELIVASGITDFYCATITSDHSYSSVVALADLSQQAANLGGELLATDDPVAAETFILEKMANHLAA
jgi:hypothetical protein